MRLSILLFVLFLLSSCSNVDSTAAGTGGGSTDSTVAPDAVIRLDIFTTLISSVAGVAAEKVYVGSCGVGPSNRIDSCTASIPEGQLYFSKLSFEVSVTEGSCYRLIFTPYSYQASASSTFTPAWSTETIDCSVNLTGSSRPSNKACYNGVGREFMGDDFPALVGRYYVLGNSALTHTFEFPVLEDTLNSNRLYANNLPASLRESDVDLGSRDGYVGGSMLDYKFSCRDKWDETKYSLTLTIQDVDLTTNTIGDWTAN